MKVHDLRHHYSMLAARARAQPLSRRVIAALALALLPLGILVYASASSSYGELQAGRERLVSARFDLLRQSASFRLGQIVGDLEGLAGKLADGLTAKEACNGFRERARRTGVAALIDFDPDGRVRCQFGEGTPPGAIVRFARAIPVATNTRYVNTAIGDPGGAGVWIASRDAGARAQGGAIAARLAPADLRPALIGTVAALALLVVAVALFGPVLALAPIHGLQLVVGILLLVFGLGWLRKAILRAGGALPLHDETATFEKETRALRGAAEATTADWLAGIAAFKAVLLEGTEVVFIVLAVAARPGLLIPAALGAAAACVLVLAAGLALRAPLSTVPENTLKFAVGGLLTGFGVFWCSEGLNAPFPGGDWAILGLVGAFLLLGLGLSRFVRSRIGAVAA